MEQIQMVDLRGQYARIKGEVDAGIREVMDSAAFVKGGKVAEFQHELEQYLGVKHVIPTGNGTDAEKEKGWGEGYYVSQMHAAGCRLDFVFTARSAQTTSISVRLSSELGQLTFTPQDLAFMLNDKELPYTTLVVKGAQTSTPDLTAAVFNDYTITTSVMLEKGENTFSIMVRQNSLRGDGNVAGPMVDSVTFTTKAVLEWTDHKDNISRRDNSESDM